MDCLCHACTTTPLQIEKTPSQEPISKRMASPGQAQKRLIEVYPPALLYRVGMLLAWPPPTLPGLRTSPFFVPKWPQRPILGVQKMPQGLKVPEKMQMFDPPVFSDGVEVEVRGHGPEPTHARLTNMVAAVGFFRNLLLRH